MLVQCDCRPANVTRVFDPPEADVLFATAHKLVVIVRTELKAENVEMGSLLG